MILKDGCIYTHVGIDGADEIATILHPALIAGHRLVTAFHRVADRGAAGVDLVYAIVAFTLLEGTGAIHPRNGCISVLVDTVAVHLRIGLAVVPVTLLDFVGVLLDGAPVVLVGTHMKDLQHLLEGHGDGHQAEQEIHAPLVAAKLPDATQDVVKLHGDGIFQAAENRWDIGCKF